MKVEVIQSALFVCHSVCMQPHAKVYAWIFTQNFYQRLSLSQRLAQSRADFILEAIFIVI